MKSRETLRVVDGGPKMVSGGATLRMNPADAPLPRKRSEIEAAAFNAAKQGSTCAMMMLQLEVLLDIRDFVSESAVRLSNIEGEVQRG